MKMESSLEAAEAVGGICADDFGFDDIRFADEGGDESGGGLVVDLVDGTDLLHAAFIDHGHAVAHGEGFLLIVGDEDEGDAEFFLQLLELDAHLGAKFGIEGAEGFVEEKDLGFADDRSRQSDPLTLTAGHLGGLAIDKGFQGGHLDHAIDAFFDFRSGNPFHPETEGDVLVDGEVGEEGVVLKDLIHIPAVRGVESHIASIDKDLAGGGCVKSTDESKAGRLAATRGPEKSHELTGLDLEVGALEGFEGAEAFADIAELNHGKSLYMPTEVNSMNLWSHFTGIVQKGRASGRGVP